MLETVDTKFKDNVPLETVNNIRNILYKLNIMTKDIWMDSGVENCHSLRVLIENTLVGQNGKGVTDEFALASGYAELYERISNDMMYIGDYSEKARKHLGFFYEPDEKYMTAEDLNSVRSGWIDILNSEIIREIDEKPGILPFMLDGPTDKRKKAIEEWKFLLPEGFDGGFDFISIPFYNVKEGGFEYFPHSVLRSTYGTNGTCTGNTPHEAIVQGLSEIFERYVNTHLITGKITPPTVPEDYLAGFKKTFSMIKAIEKKGPYSVIVKDCSLGKNYPVTAVILINYETQTYRVKFGAHPSFAIALERCLTELFQGIHLEYSSRTNAFFFADRQIDQELNLQNIIKVGSGIYPREFFGETPGYEFKPFANVGTKSNEVLAKELADILFAGGYEVFIRDNSFMGFPSFQIIVPGFSEIYSYKPMRMREKRSHDSVRSIMKNLHDATSEELNDLVIYIRYKEPYQNENNIPYLYGLPMKNSFPGGNESLQFLLILTLYKLKRFKDACNETTRLFNKIFPGNTKAEKDFAVHIRCIRDYLAAKADGKNADFIKDFLYKFYPSETASQVADQFEDPDSIFDRFYKKTGCWNCRACEMREQCDYEKIEAIYLKIKEFKKSNRINQTDCKKYFTRTANV